MRISWAFWLTVVTVLQSSVAGLPKERKAKHHHVEIKHHQTKSKVTKVGDSASQSISKPAPPPNNPQVKQEDEDKDLIKETKSSTRMNGDIEEKTTTTKWYKMINNKKVLVQTSVVTQATLDKNNKNNGKFKAHLNPGDSPAKPGFVFNLFNPFGFSGLFNDEPIKQCSNKKQCKKPGMYCDRMDNQCRKKVKLDGRCDQAGQCDLGNDKNIACLWGRCLAVKKPASYAGLFCDGDKDCHSEDLHCSLQSDISEVSKVCIYKPIEGQTCGRANMFSFFSLGRETPDLPCKNGLTCHNLKFSNRKICYREELLKDNKDDDGADDKKKKDSKDEDKKE